MFTRLRKHLRSAFGYYSTDIRRSGKGQLELLFGGVRTTLDRTTGEIRQNNKLVGMIPLVTRVELHRPSSQDGPPNWYITVHVQGGRHVQVGQEFDETSASIVGAKIATIVKKPVQVNP